MYFLALSPTCALVDIGCMPGYHCEDTPTGMRCAPDQGKLRKGQLRASPLEVGVSLIFFVDIIFVDPTYWLKDSYHITLVFTQ